MESLKNRELLKRAGKLYKNKQYDQALGYLSSVVEVDCLDTNSFVEAFFMMGNIFHMKGELGKSIKAFQKVLELSPSHIEASISLSILFNDIGKYEEGEHLYKKSYQNVKNSKDNSVNSAHINKKLSMKHFELAELYFSFERFDESLGEYNKSVALDPSNLEFRLSLSKVYAKKNFANKAHDELLKIKSEYPEYVPGRISLGVFLYGQGKVIEARIEWQKVLSLKPGHEEALMYLSMSQAADETVL